MRMQMLAIVIASGVVLAWSSLGYGVTFGPGQHWIDTVPAATVPLPGVVQLGIDTNNDGIPENLTFVGPTTIQLSGAIDDSVFFPGLRATDGHLDVVDTEVLTMNMSGQGVFSGWTLLAGTNSGLSSRTLGAMAESTIDSAVVESFFDVFFEIQGTPWGTVHNNTALHIAGQTLTLPPVGSAFEIENLPIALYDINETFVGNVTSGSKTIVPEPSTLTLLLSGLAGGFGFMRNRRNGKA